MWLGKWQSKQEILMIDAGSHRLLPFLYGQLMKTNTEARDFERIKGVHRKSWVKYQLALPGAVALVDAMTEEGFSPLLLKGTGLQFTIYRHDPASRPSHDVDVLVPSYSYADAGAWLEGKGFRADNRLSPDDKFLTLKSLGYGDENGEVDLHRWLFQYCADPLFEQRLYDRKIQAQSKWGNFHTLAPTDHFLHALVHGSGWNPVPAIRWILDAMLITRSEEGVDWDLFQEEVQRCDLIRPVLLQILYLQSEFECEVPAATMRVLSKQPKSVPGSLMNLYAQQKTITGMRLSRLLFGEFLIRRENSSASNLLARFLVDNPRIAWGVVQEFLARRRRFKFEGT
jgi:hypothetical protein